MTSSILNADCITGSMPRTMDQTARYRFAKPLPDGRTELPLTPLELIERVAA